MSYNIVAQVKEKNRGAHIEWVTLEEAIEKITTYDPYGTRLSSTNPEGETRVYLSPLMEIRKTEALKNLIYYLNLGIVLYFSLVVFMLNQWPANDDIAFNANFNWWLTEAAYRVFKIAGYGILVATLSLILNGIIFYLLGEDYKKIAKKLSILYVTGIAGGGILGALIFLIEQRYI